MRRAKNRIASPLLLCPSKKLLTSFWPVSKKFLGEICAPDRRANATDIIIASMQIFPERRSKDAEESEHSDWFDCSAPILAGRFLFIVRPSRTSVPSERDLRRAGKSKSANTQFRVR